MRELLLVGAGGLAREVLAAVRARPGVWAPLGMLDDSAARHGSTVDGVPVLGGSELVHEHPDAAVVVCVANSARPAGRLAVARKLGLPDERWATVVHPAASVPEGASLGPGTVLLAGTVLTTPLRVGAHVLAMPHVLLTHDDEIADGVTFAGRATLAGGVRVGESAYLGQGSMIREGVTIGAEAVIGMGAVVLSDVPAGQVWAGVPAKKLTKGTT
ncbi:NeuD/PglB/VioB family sugar acetyltransferase [Amycolatopsis sp. CA-230715]|uniref:NeuD/PglB/VioB family sugar acetyltransferase n=1 Tax=Amycolatopsis sp. CA-230715 TaxID=2745196 RepID=UPI001C013864|nr:NeuD/PglB/VioB family sugar acetyltransferase [Amycolatopsis sp. CA-230715]QWF79790.1 Putative acetyltransferase EpsM [Amycolatopsis sp. CA-230715]